METVTAPLWKSKNWHRKSDMPICNSAQKGGIVTLLCIRNVVQPWSYIYFIEELMDHIWNIDTFIDWGNHYIILSLKPPHAWKSKISILNKHRIVIGGSHTKGCSEILSDHLDNAYNVIGFSKSNTDFEAIIPTVNTERKHFTKNYVVNVCGGTQKISKNDSNSGLRYLTHFAFSSSSSNKCDCYMCCALIQFSTSLWQQQ